ncbi:ImmA/IrrE family metallo-endopeptidase [Spirulina major]|uniref:ImmA/IrrE family metallo-endopeptidase n=1 Tax=Spirulina major TaxID=270636 RepID=UPI0009332265|nr:ImmA/IrrE family metallo-endopeptidase [Spirulina major]
MTSENNIFSFSESTDPLEKARAALRAVRQYQQDWQEHGVDRVHKYFDDVEGDWLENFDEIPAEVSLAQISKVNFSDIVTQLKSLGLSKSFIERVAFPSWWRGDFENDAEAQFKLLTALAKRLRLEINVQGSLDLSLSFLLIPAAKFKLQKKQEKPELFSYLASSVANIVLGAVDLPYLPIPANPSVIRKSILQKGSCVSLESLLDFCWSCGLPVIQFDLSTLFGKGNNGLTKSDGLVFMTDNRPTIIIGSSHKYSAWLLFILAHELGHIACSHLQEGILSDESFKGGVNDEEEEEANQFATQLLFGDFSPRWARTLNQKTLFNKAQRLGKEQNLDPGALILNYGWQTGNWGCAMAALKRLEPNANAPTQINAYYQSHLINLDDDSREYLEQVKVLAT